MQKLFGAGFSRFGLSFAGGVNIPLEYGASLSAGWIGEIRLTFAKLSSQFHVSGLFSFSQNEYKYSGVTQLILAGLSFDYFLIEEASVRPYINFDAQVYRTNVLIPQSGVGFGLGAGAVIRISQVTSLRASGSYHTVGSSSGIGRPSDTRLLILTGLGFDL